MVSNMASCIVDALIRNKVIDIQSTSVYQYGFEIFISSTSGILFHCLTAAMVYFILFVLLRSVCGGYHAKTYWQCNLKLKEDILLLHIVLREMAHCTKAPVSIQEYYGTIQRHTKQLSKAIRESQNKL